MKISSIQFYLLLISISIYYLCQAEETIRFTKPIRDSETITSYDGTFKLGFFSLGNSSSRYVGIWFNNIQEQTVVWVANRDAPLRDSSGVFTIAEDQNLVVLDGKRNVLWATNVTSDASSSHVELFNSGNLVLREGNSSGERRIIWEIFNNPSNVILANMRLGINQKQIVTSWKSDMDPSAGNYFMQLDPVSIKIPQIIIRNGSKRLWRSGPFNGRVFLGMRGQRAVYRNGFRTVRDDKENILYMTHSYQNKSLHGYFLSSKGIFAERLWDEREKKWNEAFSAPQTPCEVYGNCGPFGYCDTLKSPICSCLKGFEPKSVQEWNEGNWSGGCMRKTQLQCRGKESRPDGFLKLRRMKVPDLIDWAGWDLQQCGERCLSNCSCTAYSYDIGTGCMSWSGNLIDIEKFPQGGHDLFIRVAHSELDKKRSVKVILVTTVLIGVLMICVLAYIAWRRMKTQKGITKKNTAIPELPLLSFGGSDNKSESSGSGKIGHDPELPILSFEKIMIATNNFDSENKLGQGGFGPVYKGKFRDRQEIAVKRLSTSSGQGLEEFKNEVVVISKLQHRNLVKLLGCCIEGEEKMLIYEYMPNKSLDAFIFDPTKQQLLDWRKRFEIIMGICRGILYLHRDSRLKVIHRDLKASNILLDGELNPKISDFGMARIFSGNELQANTIRVVGTYGYMSPEYAMEGQFSEKSDVFSFGVLLLELISGRRNNSFYHHENFLTLLGFGWELWNKGKSQELIDPQIVEPNYKEEILRCIHVGLLCVQDLAKDRPTVSSIISMLTSEITTLPTPKQPAFTGGQVQSDSDLSQSEQKSFSMNTVTITTIGGR